MNQNAQRFAFGLVTVLLLSGLATGFASTPAAASASIIIQQPLSPCIDVDTGKPFAPEPADVVTDSGDADAVPWNVQLAGGFSRIAARKQFDQVQQAHSDLLGNDPPLIVVSCKLNLGEKVSFSVGVGEPTRAAANDLCNKLQAQSVACVVEKN